MEALECIETRRSVRKYTDQPIPREVMETIVKEASFSPSWKNTQVVRYTVVENQEIKDTIADTAVLGFTFNAKTIHRCAALVVQSVVTGIAGFEPDGSYSTPEEDGWEMYDAGISAQTFCLAAHTQGVGSVILGVIDNAKIGALIHLPEGERVTALIAVGYPEKTSSAPPRKGTDELLRFV